MLILSLLIVNSAYSQDVEGMRGKAIEAFEASDYSTSAYWLKLLKEEQGSFTETRLQYMLVRSLYETKDFIGARIASSEYFNLNPSRSSPAYKEVNRIYNSLPEEFALDDAAFVLILFESVSSLNSF